MDPWAYFLEPNRFALLIDLVVTLLAKQQETLPDAVVFATAHEPVPIML